LGGRSGSCHRAASQSLRDLRVAEVAEQDVQINDGKIELYRTKLKLSFKFEEST
jgi:dodecin